MAASDLLVVKLGGGEGLDLAAASDDLSVIAGRRPLVVVHGVSAMMNQLCLENGVEVQSLQSPSGHSSRYTPPAVRELYVRASEAANEMLLSAFGERGMSAVGFVGENITLRGRRKTAIRAVVNGRARVIRDDYSGAIIGVDGQLLRRTLERSHTPVLPPMAISSDGPLNVDGDRAAAAVAGALKAETLVILSNVAGLYRHFPDETSLLDHVALAQIDGALDWAQGRMKRKVLAAREALSQGVERVIIADGRVPNPVSRALDGAGTRFTT